MRRMAVGMTAALCTFKFEQSLDIQPRINRGIAIGAYLKMTVRPRGVAR